MGFFTLFRKEMLRFLKVSVQTVAAPVLTSALYLVIFGQVLEGRLGAVVRAAKRDGDLVLPDLQGHLRHRRRAAHTQAGRPGLHPAPLRPDAPLPP